MYYDKLSNIDIKLSRRHGQEKTHCPQCTPTRKNKKDKSLSVNITTGAYNCKNCGWKGNVRAFEATREFKEFKKPSKEYLKKIEVENKTISWFGKRGISEKTLNKHQIFNRLEMMPQTGTKMNCICFPYFEEAELINIKFRDGKKNFKMVKEAKLTFFNLNSLNGKEHAIITEGEIDCLSLYEAGFDGTDKPIEVVDSDTGELTDGTDDTMGRWATLSVPNGASAGDEQKLEYLDNASDWLLDVGEFIIATDDDTAGRKLKSELVRRLGVEKCRVVEYPKKAVVPVTDGNNNILRPCKDLNEVLVYLGAEEVVKCVLESKFVPVDGIVYVADMAPQMIQNFKNGIVLAPTFRCGATIDQYIRWKKGDIYLVVGYGNHGKTFFWLQMMLIKSLYDGWKWAVFCPENFPATDFFDDLVEMLIGKWLSDMKEAHYVAALEFLNEHFFYVYPENEHDLVSIHERFRHLVLKKGIDGVMVDPYNQLDHNQKSFQREDQYLSVNLKDIKRFALHNNIVYTIVSHPKNPNTRNEDKSLPVVDMYDVAGGAMWGNKVDQIVSYYRPNFHIDKNDGHVQVYIQKLKRKRTGGQLGQFDMFLDWKTKRYMVNDYGLTFAPCDMERAHRVLEMEKSDYRQTEIKEFDDRKELPPSSQDEDSDPF